MELGLFVGYSGATVNFPIQLVQLAERLGNERLNDLVHGFPTQTLRSFETLGGVVASAVSVLCIARLTKRREQ